MRLRKPKPGWYGDDNHVGKFDGKSWTFYDVVDGNIYRIIINDFQKAVIKARLLARNKRSPFIGDT